MAVRVWMMNPYGPIPGEGWRDYRFTLAARALAKRGHDVTWFTASFDHASKRQRSGETRDADGFHIALVPTPSYAKNVSIARLRFERAFARELRARVQSLPRPDVIIAADPPQSCGAAGRALAKQFGVPLVLDVLDLWPELFVRVAPRALRPFVWLGVQPMFATRRRNMRAAKLVIVVADEYAHVAPNAKVIPIGVDVSTFLPNNATADLNLIYAGSLGVHYDIETLLEAVGTDIKLTIAGHAPADEGVRRHNVTFAGVVPPNELAKLYANASAGIATYAEGSTVALPLKLFDYFAAGLPVITSLAMIENLGAGIRYKAGDAASLRAAILSLPGRRAELSKRARELSKRFDARVLYEQYADAIEGLVR